MANIQVAFGFKNNGTLEGYAPTQGLTHRRISGGNTNPIFRGDPVVSLGTGFIQQASSNSTQIAGIFQGCEYLSVSQGKRVRSWFWPGSDANGDVDAFIINTAGATFYAVSNGSAITFANVGNNCGFFIATGGSAAPAAGSGQGNTTNGISGAMIDVAGTNGGGSGAIATTSTLPFRIVALYSDYVTQGFPTSGTTSFNGADNTASFNWAVLTLNNVDTKSLTGI